MLVLDGLDHRNDKDWKELHELSADLLELCVQQLFDCLECNPLLVLHLCHYFKCELVSLSVSESRIDVVDDIWDLIQGALLLWRQRQTHRGHKELNQRGEEETLVPVCDRLADLLTSENGLFNAAADHQDRR